MAIIAFPAALERLCNSQEWAIAPYDVLSANPITGAVRARRLAPPKWTTQLGAHSAFRPRDTALFDALRLKLDGSLNQLALHDLKYPQPSGTYRGTLTLNASVAQGATSIAIAGGGASQTLLEGDRIGIGSGAQRQVVMVMADAVANGSGVITINITPAARWAYSSGATVTWYKPTALFRIRPGDVALASRAPGLDDGGSLNLIESWDA